MRSGTVTLSRLWRKSDPLQGIAWSRIDCGGCGSSKKYSAAGAMHRPRTSRIERRIGQHHRSGDLARGDVPIGLEQPRLLRRRHQRKTVSLVEADRPGCRLPGADQHAARAQSAKMAQQHTADAVTLAARHDVSVANEVDVAFRLQAHDAGQTAVLLITPELHPGGEFAVEFSARHVRLVPPVGRDHAAIGFGGSIYDGNNRGAIAVAAGADVSRG